MDVLAEKLRRQPLPPRRAHLGIEGKQLMRLESILKCPCDEDDEPEGKPLQKCPTLAAGPSSMSKGKERAIPPPEPPVTGPSSLANIQLSPHYMPDSQDELLVLPPMPKSIYDELMTLFDDLDSDLLAPESPSDDERRGAKCIH